MEPDQYRRHLAEIEEQGYTILENVLEPDLVDGLNEDLLRLERELEVVPAGNDFYTSYEDRPVVGEPHVDEGIAALDRRDSRERRHALVARVVGSEPPTAALQLAISHE